MSRNAGSDENGRFGDQSTWRFLCKLHQQRWAWHVGEFDNFGDFYATLLGPSNWVNLFALIISSTTLEKFRQNGHFCQIRLFRQIRQHFGALLARVNLFAIIISSTTLAKFRQNRHFRHCQHFWTYLIIPHYSGSPAGRRRTSGAPYLRKFDNPSISKFGCHVTVRTPSPIPWKIRK